MKEKTETIKTELEKDLQEVKNLHEVSDLKVKYLGKKGLVTELTSNMKDLSIEEIKISLQKYIMELDKIESQITSSMNLFKENFSLLKSKKSNEAVSLGLIYESNLREERQEIMKQYADSFQKINQIKKEMIKVNDLIFNSFLNQIDNLLNAINDDSSSVISTSDRSLSDDLNELYENNYVNNELVSQINDIKKPDGMPEPNLSSINNNSDGKTMLLNELQY